MHCNDLILVVYYGAFLGTKYRNIITSMSCTYIPVILDTAMLCAIKMFDATLYKEKLFDKTKRSAIKLKDEEVNVKQV